MAKEYFIVFDKGDNWEITDTFIVPDDYEVSNDGVYNMSDNKELFEYVKQKLSVCKIQFPKETDGKLLIEDLVETPYNQLEIYKQRKIIQGKELLSTRIDIPRVFNFVEFIILNNRLLDKGFVITDDNKHEKYLEIIETDDSKLIGDLEKYLVCRDSIMIGYNWHNVYKNFIIQVKKASSVREVDLAWKDYVQSFE